MTAVSWSTVRRGRRGARAEAAPKIPAGSPPFALPLPPTGRPPCLLWQPARSGCRPQLAYLGVPLWGSPCFKGLRHHASAFFSWGPPRERGSHNVRTGPAAPGLLFSQVQILVWALPAEVLPFALVGAARLAFLPEPLLWGGGGEHRIWRWWDP